MASGGLGTWAYLQYELAKHCDKDEHRMILLHSARDFCIQVLKEKDGNDVNDNIIMTTESMSILPNVDIGAHLMLVAVYNELNEPYDGRGHLRVLLRKWKEANASDNGTNSNNNNRRNNLWYGRAGALQGIFFLRRELHSPIGAMDLAIDIAKELLEYLSGTEDAVADESIDDGMTIGRIGILYTLLGMEEEEWKILESSFPGCQKNVQSTIETNYLFLSPFQETNESDACDVSWASIIMIATILHPQVSICF